jgi:signal transduction histidine kinase
MWLVAVSLIIAQTINLFILVGESRLRARTNIIETVIKRITIHVQTLPTVSKEDLPFELRGRNYRNGRFFLSNESQVAKLDGRFVRNNYDGEVKTLLGEQNFEYLSFELALKPFIPGTLGYNIGPKLNHHAPHRPRRKGPNGQRPPPPRKNFQPKGSVDTDVLVLSIELKSGVWFTGMVPHTAVESLAPRIIISTLALLFITLLGIAFFMRKITQPLSAFANAAEEFGRGNNPIELSEDGPGDIRKAAQSFNSMQRRLSRMLETQRNMLRAVGHDLRTPLTSLRIRSEMIPEEFQRDKFITTIDEMSSMTEEILSWTKNSAGLEHVATVNLYSLLSSIVDDFSDQGEESSLECDSKITLSVRRLSMKRALTNVINNALKYGHSAKVSVEETDQNILIHVEDRGPGIPEGSVAEALKPFVRLEASRNKDTGGSGLGLSITETIVQAEGGKLLFKNLSPKGLRVTLSLPR